MKRRRQGRGAGSSGFSDRAKQPRDRPQYREQRELPHAGYGERSPEGAEAAGHHGHDGPRGGRTRDHSRGGMDPRAHRKPMHNFAPDKSGTHSEPRSIAARGGRPDTAPMRAGLPYENSRVGEDGGDMVFGVEPVRELVAATPSAVRKLYLRAGTETRFRPQADAVRAAGGKVASATEQGLRRMTGTDARHQGIVAIIREYQYAVLEEVLSALPNPLLLVDGITDPRNLGALLRSAEGAGVRAVVIARDHTVGLTPAAIKSSAGAWVHLGIARCGNVVRTLEALKLAGYWIATLTPDGTTDLYDLDATRRLALIVGSEGRGVRELVKKRADFTVRIPMHGRVDSLNVAVATAVALFEIARRKASSKNLTGAGQLVS